MKQRVHLYISGIVQGVVFRYFLKQTADALGIFGWAKNLAGGRVEVVFEGEKGAVKQAVNEAWQGPPAGKVREVEVVGEAWQGEKEFAIVR